VDDVQPALSGSAPEGAIAVEAVVTGALLVAVAPALIGGVVDVVASWLRRQPADIEVEIGGRRFKGQVTGPQRDELVAAFLHEIPVDRADPPGADNRI
jgi:hypothetical protein